VKFVVGLDLSLRSSGVCVLPVDWSSDGFEWSSVSTESFGYSLPDSSSVNQRATRWISIAESIFDFVNARTGKAEWNVHRVWIESYAFSRKTKSAHELAELGGVVKAELSNHYDLSVATPQQCRKTFLGKEPRSEKKRAVQRQLVALGCPFHDREDEADAFVVANHGLMVEGFVGLSCPAP